MAIARDEMTDAPVRKTVTVAVSPERAFRIFTEEFDAWWPRTHHIGSAPLERAVIEPRLGGRCYGRSVDGTECAWGAILAWEPPHRFVLAWRISPEWQPEPDPAKASEVEFRFTPEPGGRTRVDVEHRHFTRHGAGGGTMRTAVDGPNGWSGLLQLFAAEAERAGR
jgi:uncharacterized protein YndB with AHSA1/START domain